jgi:exodeoxyribonuclease VIII
MSQNYQQIDGLNYSTAKFILQSPQHYQDALANPIIQTHDMLLGSLAHLLTFQPAEAEKAFVVLPEDAPKKPTSVQRNAKKPSDDTVKAMIWWDEFISANSGKAIIDAEDYQVITGIATSALAALKSLPIESMMVENAYHKEMEPGIFIKGRPDCHGTLLDGRKFILDLKSARSARPGAFASEVADRMYHMQAAFYRELLGHTDADPYYLIPVEKDRVFGWRVFQLDTPTIEQGKKMMHEALFTYSMCKRTNRWPGYPTDVATLSIPNWAFDK